MTARFSISGKPSQELYTLIGIAAATPRRAVQLIGVEAEGMMACPCAQEMVRAQAEARLREHGLTPEATAEVLSLVPVATHNQRGRGRLLAGADRPLRAEDLVEIVEGAMSSENYDLLKRPDELFVVEKAHRHPRFVEDTVREMLLADETAPYRDERSNVQIAGPEIQLSPKSAVSLGMAFHELTTNAAKYGALSGKGGNLAVTWSTTTNRELRIRWREFGGPVVQTPERRGFGRLLLERALRADLDADVRLDFAAAGLECSITFPLDRTSASHDGQPLTMQ